MFSFRILLIFLQNWSQKCSKLQIYANVISASGYSVKNITKNIWELTMRMGVSTFSLKSVIFCMEYWCYKDAFFLSCRKGMLIPELWIFSNVKGTGFGGAIYKKTYSKFSIFLFYITTLTLIIIIESLIVIIECRKKKHIITC